jgi:Oxidoreductase FAD-binding domain
VETTAVRRRLTWQLARVVEVVTENARTKTIALDAAGWPDYLAGQHVDVRLTAEDGYQAQRSYSIASAPEDEHLILTVERLADGEVSPYLTETLERGDELELRGPIGGYFVWRSRSVALSSLSAVAQVLSRSGRCFATIVRRRARSRHGSSIRPGRAGTSSIAPSSRTTKRR